MTLRTALHFTEAQRQALEAVLDGLVRLGVEENIICPGSVDRSALGECFTAGYCCWDVGLPGGRATPTDLGIEAMRRVT